MLVARRCKCGVVRRWLCNSCIHIWLTISVATVFLFTVIVSPFTPVYSESFLNGLKGPLAADDPQLLTYIRSEILEPPSMEPYNLTNENNKMVHLLKDASVGFYDDHLNKIFKNKRNGFFVEAGALDGESMSNTLKLEQNLEWSGLLVEVDSISYQGLKSKHRKAWSANVCLSPTPYPTKELFEQRNSHFATIWIQPLAYKQRAMSTLLKFSDEKVLAQGNWNWVQCLPLESLLLALEVRTVDLLVLDVEGAELAILDHLDLNQFNVQVLCIEWKKRHELDVIVERLEMRGYKLLARKHEDIILAKKGSPYEDYRS